MKTRILFFINNLAAGGAERALINVVNKLDKDKYDITVKTIFNGGDREAQLPEGITYCPIVNVHSNKIRKICTKIICKLPPNLFCSLFLREEYDVEVSFLQGLSTYFLQHSRNERSKKISFVHSDVKDYIDKSIAIYGSKRNINELYGKMNRVCFISEALLESWQKILGENHNQMVIENIIDVESILEEADAKPDYEYTNSINIVTCGRLVIPVKGFDRLIKAIAHLKDYQDIFTVHIFGDGPDKEELVSLIQLHRITNVRFYGYKENVYPNVKNATAYVCSSIDEGFGLSIAEAAILGKPIITTSFPAINEVLDKTDSVIITENSTEGLIDGLHRFISDDRLRNELTANAKRNAAYYQDRFKARISEYDKLFQID